LHINADILFDKDMYATLSSLVFSTTFAVVSLLAGTLSDNLNKGTVIAAACAIWSAATALQATASTYQHLLLLRVTMAASQAFFNPAAFTLIADLFPPRMVGGMNGILSSGIFLGGGAASLSILLDNAIGWRNTAAVVGGIGIFTAGLSAVLLSKSTDAPERAETSHSAEISKAKPSMVNIKQAVQEVFGSQQARLLFAASALRFCAGFSIIVWKAPFVFAKFPAEMTAFSGSNAAIVAVGGLVSSLLGGFLSDRLSAPSSGRAYSRIWVPAVGSWLAAPLWAAFLLTSSPQAAAVFLLCEYLAAECWFGPTLAAIFAAVPAQRRGAAQGVFSMLTAAANVAPIAVGRLSDALSSRAGAAIQEGSVDVGALSAALLVVVCGAYVASAGLFSLAAVHEDRSSVQNNVRK
jgi:MFS family permease